MRTLAVVAAALALLAGPAEAQMGGGRKGPKPDDSKAADQIKQKAADEKAYQDALKRIPESKEKYDPWAVTKKPSQ
jgi:hypothetical protein